MRHFTSPIRRYADLIVHRALIKALGLGTDGLTSAEEAQLEEISALISATERRAMLAERETVDRLIAHFLASHLGDEYEGARYRRHARRSVRQSCDHMAQTDWCPFQFWAMNIIYMTKQTTQSRANEAAGAFVWAIR